MPRQAAQSRHSDMWWPVVAGPVPAVMRAMVLRRFGDPDVLEAAEAATPRIGADQVLVRVAAVSVGRLLDLTARAGTHPYARFALPHILGAEHAGTVAAVGSAVESVRVGDRVAVFPVVSCGFCEFCLDGCTEACPAVEIMGVHRHGSYAEYTAVPAVNVHRVPDGLEPCDAAGLALAGAVAINQLSQAGLRDGDWVLVQGGASALGSLTAALAAHLGARVIVTSRDAWKRERLLQLGATAALDATSRDFVADVLARTDGKGVRVAIDNLGDGAIADKTLAVLAVRGAVVCSGAFLGGTARLDLMRLYSRNQRVLGVRSGNPGSARRLWQEVEKGFRPILDRSFPIAQAAEAHRYLEADNNLGRVTLTTAAADWI